MGSPLGPLTANEFVGFLEQQLFDRVQKPYCYFSYVDYTFACFSSSNEATKIFHRQNNLHKPTESNE